MTLMEFFGCTLISFGPPFALFLFTIARDPLRVIVLMASGFFWLLSLLLSALLWYAIVPLRDYLAFGLAFSTIFQELFRFLLWKIMRLADDGLVKISQESENSNVTSRDITNKHIMSYVSGLGFGIIAGAFSMINVLADMSGPGTIGIQGDSKYFFWSSAFLTLCFILLHTCWGVIFFDALDKKQYFWIVLVVCSHLFVSYMTLLNQRTNDRDSLFYLASLLPAYGSLIVMAIIAFTRANGTVRNLKHAFICRKGRYEID